MQTQPRERTVDPYFQDLTDLLGSQLIAPGFRLYLNRYRHHLVFGGKDIKRFSVNHYSLKAIKRYCRLYLRKIRDPGTNGHSGLSASAKSK